MRDAGHEFALFVSGISNLDMQTEQYIIEDKQLVHRISRILRLHPDDNLILFDSYIHLAVRVGSIEKKRIVCTVKSIEKNRVIMPYITVWLPLLKREAFEQAIYSLVELGVNEIQLVHVAKEQRYWHGAKELTRIQNIMVAAAEQSKNFSIPQVHEPKILDQLQGAKDCPHLFFDVKGEPLLEVVQTLRKDKHNRYVLLVGPEGDLTESEKYQLQQASFRFVYLTPTVLRAQQALVVGVGALRSLLS